MGIFRNMKVVLVLFLLLLTANADVERCQEVLAQFNRCTEEAHMTYAAAVNKGNDGRPDFHARKACNYAEDAIQGCGNQLPGECFTQEQVDEKKDAEIAQILKCIGVSDSKLGHLQVSRSHFVCIQTKD